MEHNGPGSDGRRQQYDSGRDETRPSPNSTAEEVSSVKHNRDVGVGEADYLETLDVNTYKASIVVPHMRNEHSMTVRCCNECNPFVLDEIVQPGRHVRKEVVDIFILGIYLQLFHTYGWGDKVRNNEEDEEDYIDHVGDGDGDDKHPSRGERDRVRSYNKLTEQMIYKGTPERKTSFPNGVVDLKPGMKVEYNHYMWGLQISTVREIEIKEKDEFTSDEDVCWYDDYENEDKLITMKTADGTTHRNEDRITIVDDDGRKIYGDSCVQLVNFRCRAGISDKVDDQRRRLSDEIKRIRHAANNPFELLRQTDQTDVAKNEEEQYRYTRNKYSTTPFLVPCCITDDNDDITTAQLKMLRNTDQSAIFICYDTKRKLYWICRLDKTSSGELEAVIYENCGVLEEHYLREIVSRVASLLYDVSNLDIKHIIVDDIVDARRRYDESATEQKSGASTNETSDSNGAFSAAFCSYILEYILSTCSIGRHLHVNSGPYSKAPLACCIRADMACKFARHAILDDKRNRDVSRNVLTSNMKENTWDWLRNFSLRRHGKCALCLHDEGSVRVTPHLGYVCCVRCGSAFHQPCFSVAVHTAKEKAGTCEKFICACCNCPALFVSIDQRRTKSGTPRESSFDSREDDWKDKIPNSINAEAVEDETLLRNLLPKILQKDEGDDTWETSNAQFRCSEVIVIDDDDDKDQKPSQTQQSQLGHEVIVIDDDDDDDDEKPSHTKQPQLSHERASNLKNSVVHAARTISMFTCSSPASVLTETRAVSSTTRNGERAPRVKRRHDDVGGCAGMCKEVDQKNGSYWKRKFI